MRLIDPKTFRLELDKLDCIDKFGYVILPITKLNIALERSEVDAVPVVRGRWIGYPECLKYTNAYSDDHIVCSACEECFSILDNDCERFNFCPNCGAKMDGGADDAAD